VARLLAGGSREYAQRILRSASSCLPGRGGTLHHTHMFLKCSNVLLFYCRCMTEMKFNNLLYTRPIKWKDSLPWRSWTKYDLEAVWSADPPRPPSSHLPCLQARHPLFYRLLWKGGWVIKKEKSKQTPETLREISQSASLAKLKPTTSTEAPGAALGRSLVQPLRRGTLPSDAAGVIFL